MDCPKSGLGRRVLCRTPSLLLWRALTLGGPAAILFTSRDTCSDSIAKVFRGCFYVGPATTQNLVVKFDGEIGGGVLVENASGNLPQQMKLENLRPNFAGGSPPISPKTSPTSLWKSLGLIYGVSHSYRAIRCKMGHRTDVPV